MGVPTYERAGTLERAVASALAQTHTRLEVVISDNGSADETEQLCRALASRDPRVRCHRHERNRGSTANFNHLFESCKGEYVMMLADDDWLDPDYVARCLAALRGGRNAALVGGRPRYVRAGIAVGDGVRHHHCEADPAARILAYLRAVDDNGVFYGLMPREVLHNAAPLPNVLGNDWLQVARIAAQGSILVLDDVRIHRELGGTSVDITSILSSFGQPRWQARVPQLIIAWQLLRDIGWNHPVYERIGGVSRIVLGLRAAWASMRWRALAWHVVTPSVLNLTRRPRGRRIWALYDRLTRALGAGRLQ